MALKIVQISDCHVSADPSTSYRGQDAEANLEAVWRAALRWKPDLVLLTGDLSEDASPASYDRLGALLQAGFPTVALPGNHDDHDLMRRHFPNGPWEAPFAWESGDWCIVATDSTLPGEISGGFSDTEIEALRSTLAASKKSHLMVALHHQPIPVEAPWIDRWPLENPAAFLEVIESEPRLRCVIWGHIHHHFAAVRNGVLMLGAPSTAANSEPNATRFALDAAGPACRKLGLMEDGAVAYSQIYARAG